MRSRKLLFLSGAHADDFSLRDEKPELDGGGEELGTGNDNTGRVS